MMVATGDNSKITISMEDLRKLIKTEVQEQIKNNVPMFIDTNRLLTTITTQGASWTATEDCAVVCSLIVNDQMMAVVYVDGVTALGIGDQQTSCSQIYDIIYVKKGSVISTRESYGTYNLKVYGLK